MNSNLATDEVENVPRLAPDKYRSFDPEVGKGKVVCISSREWMSYEVLYDKTESCPATEAVTEISKPTPVDILQIRLLAEIHTEDSEIVAPNEATFDILKYRPKTVKETDPDEGLIPEVRPETLGEEKVNETNALLRTRK